MPWGLFSTAKYQQEKLAEAESSLITPHVQGPYRAHKVEIEPDVFVHTLTFGEQQQQQQQRDDAEGNGGGNNKPDPRRQDEDVHHMVLTHGYASGIGFWYRNYGALSNIPNVRLHSIDWLGNGQSTRVSMPKEPEKAEEVENLFVDSLEKWRERMNIDRMVLVGHSLGGFLSACYALKYPDRVEKLVLVSPVGLPEKPADWDSGLEERLVGRPAWQRGLYNAVRSGWDKNITPQSVLRGLGPFGPSVSESLIGRRFSHVFTEDERKAIAKYFYHNAALKGSGEYALNTILSFGAFARRPLASRLGELSVPTTFLYGAHDWMDHRHAQELIPQLKVPAKLYIIDNAGHQLFIENPAQFNRVMHQIILEHRERQRAANGQAA